MDFSKELGQRVKEAIEAVPEAVASTAKTVLPGTFLGKGVRRGTMEAMG